MLSMDQRRSDVAKACREVLNWQQYRKEKRLEQKKWKEAIKAKKLKKLEEDRRSQNEQTEPEENCDAIVDQGRKYTVSIAVPGSILDNAQSIELKTYLAGQVARAAAVFNVDEIVVFDEYAMASKSDAIDDDEALRLGQKNQGCRQLVRLLQFLECPQYLRKYFFPLHHDLEYAGLLNPLDSPHHLRVEDECKYREGIVLKKPVKENKGSFVYIGLQKTAIIDKALTPNLRVTVKLNDEQPWKKHLKGTAVSPSVPCKKDGLYWGYTVRFASSFGEVFSSCPYKEGYDTTVGTSDKGDDVDSFVLNHFKHLLIVFGGLKGLETCIESDEALGANDPRSIFHHYLNTCPSQGSRTIRTEEAILITLSVLRPQILKQQQATMDSSCS